MLKIKKNIIYGWAILPCFKVKMIEGTEGAELLCSPFLEKMFALFFAPFWNGKIHMVEVSNAE